MAQNDYEEMPLVGNNTSTDNENEAQFFLTSGERSKRNNGCGKGLCIGIFMTIVVGVAVLLACVFYSKNKTENVNPTGTATTNAATSVAEGMEADGGFLSHFHKAHNPYIKATLPQILYPYKDNTFFCMCAECDTTNYKVAEKIACCFGNPICYGFPYLTKRCDTDDLAYTKMCCKYGCPGYLVSNILCAIGACSVVGNYEEEHGGENEKGNIAVAHDSAKPTPFSPCGCCILATMLNVYCCNICSLYAMCDPADAREKVTFE